MPTATPDPDTESLRGRIQRYTQTYRDWFAAQPHQHLTTTMLTGLGVAFVLYWLLRGLFSLFGWLFSALFGANEPAPAPVPPPAAEAPPSPIELATNDTITYLAERIQDYSTAHAFGPDPTVVPLLWLLIGAVLVLFTRTLPGAVLFTAWAVATVWAVYTAIPGGNPVPAALLAGLIALAWCVWLLLSGLVKGLLNTIP